RSPLRDLAPAIRRGPGRRAQRGHLRRRAWLRRARLRRRLLERPAVGLVVRAHGQPRAVDRGARGRQPDGLAFGAPGDAWLAATSRRTAASAIRRRPPSPSAAPARTAAAGSWSTSTPRAGSTIISA